MDRRAVFILMLCILFTGILGGPHKAAAEEPGNGWLSKVISTQGRVLLKRSDQFDWRPVQLDDVLYPGDRIKVEADSRAGIVLSNDAVLRLDQNTTMVFTAVEKPTTFFLELLRGAANFFSRRPRSLNIVTPFVNGIVEGTEFYVRVTPKHTRIDLFEGRILAQNQFGALQLTAGQGTEVRSGLAPQPGILVHPRDSVQWALYYPLILAVEEDVDPPEVKEALQLYRQGRPAEALERLRDVPPHKRDARHHIRRAGLLLHVGRVDQALADIEKGLALDPENSDAKALEAVIAVVQNRKTIALRAARAAVQRDPEASTARLALSYAHQAGFNLEGAVQAAQDAVACDPESGTAWARLAELRLCVGDSEAGLNAAQKAVALDPNEGHAQTVLGFAYLTRLETGSARNAFRKAITLDSAAPLPRLGLGLAEIRAGRLKQGRGEIEIAAGLDPANALIRSYLGKAYFDEKRGPLDEHQFDIAKQLDPNDPTPWFYDAIRKQTLNRPVEAFQDLQKSIELNGNRAVYRSRLMLDEDLAVRSAGLGRIFNDLGFQYLALTEGYTSLNSDTTNYSAHRLLADCYAAKPRHEIARVSELLQSQLFQPINLIPIQARLAESDTAFLEGAGPGTLSFNEYNPLFTRNRTALQASAVVGNHSTWGHDAVVSAVLDKVSLNIGELHYITDGYRENNDYSQDIANAFIQGRLTSKTDLQAEYRYSQIEKGDRSQNFDGGFSSVLREKEGLRKVRFGARHQFSHNFESILSWIATDYENHQDNTLAPTLPESTLINERNRRGYLVEGRGDYRQAHVSMVAGAGYLDEHVGETTEANLGPPFYFPVFVPGDEADITKSTFYAYSCIRPSESIQLTIGASVNRFERGEQIDMNQLNPKFGILWQPVPTTTFRLAAFRALSSTNVSTQTIEPTHVCGFNQLFDDQNGSDVWNYGAAVAHDFSDRLLGGMEFSQRFLEVPEYNRSSVESNYYSWKEQVGLAYLYWMPADYLAIRAGYQYEHFDREENPLSMGISTVTTHKFPLKCHLDLPQGFSWGFTATYLLQEGDFEDSAGDAIFSGSDSFWVVDAEMSFRLPRRLGAVTIGVKNVFDLEFNYQETNPSNPTISPCNSIYAKLTLAL